MAAGMAIRYHGIGDPETGGAGVVLTIAIGVVVRESPCARHTAESPHESVPLPNIFAQAFDTHAL